MNHFTVKGEWLHLKIKSIILVIFLGFTLFFYVFIEKMFTNAKYKSKGLFEEFVCCQNFILVIYGNKRGSF